MDLHKPDIHMDNPLDIIVLTAVYDDWVSFKRLLGDLDTVMQAYPHTVRVVVVDDGSPTFADEVDFSDLHLAKVSKVTAVTMTRNLGNQRAVAIGLGYIAQNFTCDYLVIMDSDLEDLPEYVPQLIDAAQNEKNSIIFAERTRRPDGSAFKGFYFLYKGLYKLFTGMSISMGNFSIVPGRLVRRVAGISEIWNHFPAGIMRARVPFKSIPSERGQRIHGSSKMNMVSLVIHGLSGLAAHADVVVVRAVLGIIAVGLLILAIIGFLVFQKLFTDNFLLGWTSQIVTVLGGTLLQVFVAAVFIVFLILVGRHQKLVVPSVDFEDYILEITNLVVHSKHP